jgi:hypothetical protein
MATRADASPATGAIAGARRGGRLASTDFDYFRSTSVTSATNSSASSVDEPSVANDGNVVLYTGNWYGAISTDSGNSFTYINPYTLGPTPTLPQGGFCCDQAAIHTPSVSGYDVTVWALLYCNVTNCSAGIGDNIIRLAVARNQGALSSSTFDYYDFSAQSFGFAAGDWLDYPHLAADNGYVFLSMNIFDSSGNFVTSIMVRFDDGSFAGGGYSYNFYYNNHDFTWTPTDNSIDSWGYWAGTQFGNGGTVRIYDWPAGLDYTHIAYNDFSVGFNSETKSGSCPDPHNINWCSFDDSRVKTGGEVGTGTAYFMWDAAQGGGFAYPYVDYISVNVASGPATSISESQIWNGSYAWAYPGMGVNGRGALGVSLQIGGGTWGEPGSQFLIDDDISGGWAAVGLTNGGYASSRWGDYLTARVATTPTSIGNTWIATGFVLDGSGNTQPAFYWLGRNRDDPFAPSWSFSYSPTYTEGLFADDYSGVFVGPSNCTCDYFGLLYWGDGNASYTDLWNYATDDFLMHLNYAYAEEGTYTQTMYGEDNWGNVASGTATATVADAALTAHPVPISVTQGSTFHRVVDKFTDADPGGTATDYSATINWGDGTTTAGTIGGAFTVSGTHKYALAGTYTIKTSIADIGGATTVKISHATVAYARPVISSVTPNAGPLAGGNTLTIKGHYFTGATSVQFGTVTAASFTFVSDSVIKVKAPASAAGTVDMRVTTPGGTSNASTADKYTYVAAPKVTKISPTSGTHLGGTTVTVTGTNFTFVTAVLFGTTPGTNVQVLSTTKLTVVSPAEPAGTLPIRVKNAGGESPLAPADKYKFT